MAAPPERRGGHPGYRFTNRVIVGHLRMTEFPNGDLISLCWCERRNVRVAPEAIRDGRTESCGHPDCKAPSTEDVGRWATLEERAGR